MIDTFHRQFAMVLVLLPAVLFSPPGSLATENEPNRIRIKPREKWSTVFGGSDVKLHFEVSAPHDLDGLIQWLYTANGRTLAAGEIHIRAVSDQTVIVEIPLHIPTINDAVVIPTELSVSITESSHDDVVSMKRPITIFPESPFFGQTKWLNSLSISLFDPSGKTANVFDEAGIPFRRIGDTNALAQIKEGLLIVGEGVSFARRRLLAESLILVARRGVSVLCLAPGDGTLVLPHADEADVPPSRMTFRRNDVITELDKRLDSDQWIADDEQDSRADIAINRIMLRGNRSRIVADVVADPCGWPWIELKFGHRSSLLYCGFEIIERWNDSPSPRFLFIRILEHLTDTPDNAE